MTFLAGTTGTFTVTTTGTPAPTLSETGALPAGVTFSAATGTLSGMPQAGTAGTYQITFTAHNGAGADATQSFTLTVNQAAAITSANNTTFTVGTAGTFTLTATGSPTPTLSETGSLPPGVTFTAATGTLSGTPTGSGGTYPITFTAHNGAGADATQNFTLTVNQSPAITTNPANQTVTAGSNANFSAAASGSPAPTVQWQVSTDNGVTFNSVAGATSATLTLTAVTAAQTGNKYRAVFTNTLGNATTTASTLGVVPPPAITSFTAGATTITAGNSTTLTPVFSVGAGTVNNGVGTVTSAAAVNVTPAVTTTYTLTVTNAAGTSVTAQVTVTVVAAPVITSFTPGAATITAGNSTTLTAVFSGGTGSVNNGVGAVTSATAVPVTPLATTTYSLTVTNAAGTSVTQQTTVTVVAAPVITSFTPGAATITAGNSTTLTAVFSGGTGSVDHAVGAVISGTPVNISPSTTTVYTLTVTNTATTPASVSATTTVTVNTPPAFTSNNSTTFTVGLNGTFKVMTTGNPAPTLSVTSGSLPNNVAFADNHDGTATISGIPATSTAGNYTITITAHNGVASDAAQVFTLSVALTQPPAITTNPANQTVTAGSNANFAAAASGSPAPTVQWQVSVDNGVTFNSVGGATSATLTLTAVTAAQNGNSYRAVFTNLAGSATTTAATLGVVPPPAITSFTAGATTITAGNSTTLTAVFSGGAGSVNNGVGTVTSATAVPVAPSATTTYTVTVTNTAGTTVTQQATVTVVAVPVITSFTPGAATITAGNSTTLTAVFSGGTGIVNSGVGTVTSATTLNVTPAVTTTYTLTVTNAAGTTVTQQATVTVVAAPVITSFTPGAATITAGNSTTLTAVFSGGTGSVDHSVGPVTSGTAVNLTPSISTTVTLIVTNAAGASVTANTTVTVVAAPVITSFTPGAATITAGNSTTLTAVFSGGTGSVDHAVGPVTSGTPINISPSTTTVYTLTVTNTATTPATATAQTTVTVSQAPTIISANSANFTVGSPGAFTLTASGGITPYTWSWAAAMGSSLPPGLNVSTNNINNNGSISGTPTAAGSFSVVVTVTDSQSPGAKGFATLNIVIAPPPALLITSGNPINGMTATAYGSGGSGFTLTATGGVKPFTWSWAAKSGSGSQPPPGLSISTPSGTSGLIQGTPSVAGSFLVTVTLTDSTNATVSADYNITITVPSGCIRGPATLCGQFTFLAQGATGTTEAPVMIAGTFTADGNNHITAGILDFNSGSLHQTQVPITLGPPTAYQVGQDGRGAITLATSTTINGTGTIQFTFALNSTGTFAFLFESDDVSTTGTGNHASGYLQAVDSTKFTAASISGGYALGLLGGTSSTTRPRSSAIAAVSASGTGCGLASNGNALWINDAGIPATAPTSFTCGNAGLTTIDPSTGRGTVTIVLASGPLSTLSLNFSFYVIDATKLIFISTDFAGPNLPILSGTMFQQVKTSFNSSDLACGFRENAACVFGLSGESATGSRVGAGRAVGSTGTSLTITRDDNNGGVFTPTNTADRWTVTISANGLGAIAPPFNANSSSVEFVLIDTDNAILAVADGSVQVGFIRRQTASAPSSAPGRFIFGTQLVANGGVTNATGYVALAPPAANPSTIAGIIDLEQTLLTPTEVTGAQFNGTYTMNSPATGRGTGTTTSPSAGPSQFVIWNVGPKEIILLESDSTNKQPMLIDLLQ